MPGYNHSRRPARRGTHWHWRYHRALQNLHIEEGRQSIVMRREPASSPGLARKCRPIPTTVESSAQFYFSIPKVHSLNPPLVGLPFEPSFSRHGGIMCLFNLRVRFQHRGSILSTEVTPDAKLIKPPRNSNIEPLSVLLDELNSAY
jgi:hypothetical protein